MSFEAEGFLRVSPGREFVVQGNGAENRSGLLALRAVVDRETSEEIIALAAKQGLEVGASFDDAHPGLVLYDTIGEVNFVEHLAKDLVASGYHRLAER